MQSYTEIPSSQSLQSSLALLLNNDKTGLSNSSGTAFPTTNLQVGMLCLRTDQNKLYILKDATPTWSLIWDFAAPAVTKGANIGGSANLNAYTATGWYHQNANANAAGGTNYPEPVAGLLSVYAESSMVYQQYQTYDSTPDLYFRSYYSGTWSPWRKVWHGGNDGAGSGLDADSVDGYSPGNASGNIPLSNGTVNTNLNADLLDGRHAGNVNGNIPISNGSVNANLNADLLDGYHATSFVRTVAGVAPDASGNVASDTTRVAKSGDTMTGNLTITTGGLFVRGWGGNSNSGVLFLNANNDRYVYYDGANYHMPGANLYVAGGLVWHSGNIGTPLNAVGANTTTSSGSGNIISSRKYSLQRSGNAVHLLETVTYTNCNCNCASCFPAGSVVLMADGSWKEISLIRAGDFIQGPTGPWEVERVDLPILGPRDMWSFEDGSMLWSAEHPLWARNVATGKQWWWSADPDVWRHEIEIGVTVGLFDNHSIMSHGDEVEFAHLEEVWVQKRPVKVSGYGFDTQLYLPIAKNGDRMGFVNGYLVTFGTDQYKYDYSKFEWGGPRK